MDTIQLIAEISILKKKMDKAEAFLEELVEYLLVTCKNDDYITPEVICRKLAKYGYIELENGYWVNPLAERIAEQTEPQTDCYMCKWLGEVDVCGRCRNRNLFCEAEPQPRCPKCGKRGYIRSLESMGVKLKHFDEYKWKCTNCNRYFKEEPKDEPQTCSVNGRPYSECADCEYFKCVADEPQIERSSE